jgi:drug/metabolite transporter (DMT)-like permease
VPSALGFVLWGYAVANLPMATSTSLLYLVPAFAVLIGFVWLGEVPLVGELLGGVVVIAGVMLVSRGDRILAGCVGWASRRSRMLDPLDDRVPRCQAAGASLPRTRRRCG